jgi:hypothetical protein
MRIVRIVVIFVFVVVLFLRFGSCIVGDREKTKEEEESFATAYSDNEKDNKKMNLTSTCS